MTQINHCISTEFIYMERSIVSLQCLFPQPDEVLQPILQVRAAWVLPKLKCGCRWPRWVITATGESWNAEMLKPVPNMPPATLQEFPWG